MRCSISMKAQGATLQGGMYHLRYLGKDSAAGKYCGHPLPFSRPLRFVGALPFARLAEMIADGIVKIRDTLDAVTHVLPKDDHTRREYAQRFLEATEKSDEKRASLKKG